MLSPCLEGSNKVSGSHVAKIFKDKEGEKKLWKQDGMDERDEEDMLDRYSRGNRIACAYDGSKYGHVTQIDDMIDAVIENRDPQIMPLESIKTIRIIEAIYKSAKTGETVYFD